MRRLNWRWLLPVVQLILALWWHVYEPHEFRLMMYRDHVVNNSHWSLQHMPASSGRVSQGLNFPAKVLVWSFWNDNDPRVFSRNTDYTYISITGKDLLTWLGLVLLWYGIGRTLDVFRGQVKPVRWSRHLRVPRLVCGMAFGLATGICADQLLAREFLPQRQIGAAGMAWAVLIVAYFAQRLIEGICVGGHLF